MNRLLFLLFVCLFSYVPFFLSAQVFVRANSNCTTGCGASWADAWPNLQDALASTNSGEIWVAQGIYRPTDCAPCANVDREVAFSLKNGVAIYGGFAGTET